MAVAIDDAGSHSRASSQSQNHSFSQCFLTFYKNRFRFCGGAGDATLAERESGLFSQRFVYVSQHPPQSELLNVICSTWTVKRKPFLCHITWSAVRPYTVCTGECQKKRSQKPCRNTGNYNVLRLTRLSEKKRR